MMEIETLITGGIGILTTIVGSWSSWIFARKKYNTEVDSNLILNMLESLDFYKKLSDDNRERLEIILRRNEELESEVKELRNQLFSLMSSICTDLSCLIRKREFLNAEFNKDEKSNT